MPVDGNEDTRDAGWDGCAPTFTWRPSQSRILGILDHAVDDRRWHLCAPPGAGKTLIGLELARRVGARTLVLAPTTAIRDQWVASTRLFGADPGAFALALEDGATSIPAGPTLVAATYQLLGNPGRADDDLRQAAAAWWRHSLSADTTAAGRVEVLQRTDPDAYEKELRQWVRTIRRTISDPSAPLPARQLLGERTCRLIDDVVAAGITTIVLDECHHLLDWWALTLAELCDAVERQSPSQLAVIGCTATLPDPDSAREADNYLRLLGAVDAEIPMPALVVEGELAPWRDAVWCATPTTAELAFLEDRQRHLADALEEHLVSDACCGWAVRTLLEPALVAEAAVDAAVLGEAITGVLDSDALDGDVLDSAGAVGADAWTQCWDRDPPLAAALTAWWSARGLSLPEGFHPPGPVPPYDVATRLELVFQAAYHGGVAPRDRADLVRTLARFGVSLSAAGVRRTRSVADIVASRSAAKHAAAAEVLQRELNARGDGLRALVVVETDRATTPAAAKGVLADRSTLLAAADALVAGAGIEIGVIAVSGSGWWVDAAHADAALAICNLHCGEGRWCTIAGIDVEDSTRLVAIETHGGGWSPSRCLAVTEHVLDAGVVRALCATRALVGEGWDHPPLNVLVDCSEAASATAVTQLRGRAVRLDPGVPEKCASLWDVVCVHPAAGAEWDRVLRKHRRWWGPDSTGAIVTGPEKSGPALASAVPPPMELLPAANEASAAAAMAHDVTRAAWRSCDVRADDTAGVRVRPHRVRSVRVRGPVRRRVWAPAAAVASGVVLWPLLPWVALGALAAGAAGAVAVALPRRRATADARVWESLGSAVASGLVAAGCHDLAGARVVVGEAADGFHVSLAEATPSSAVWASALAEMLGPPGTPRWLVAVGEETWRVPTVVGASRDAADAFASALRTRLPGARLLRAGTPEATAALLAAAQRRADSVDVTRRWR